MNAPLARFAWRLSAQAPWRMVLVALAVGVTLSLLYAFPELDSRP